MGQKLNMKRILEQLDITDENEFARIIGVSMDELQQYKEGISADQKILDKIMRKTDLGFDDLYCGDSSLGLGIKNVEYTWEPSRIAKDDLIKYIQQGRQEILEDTVQEGISKVALCISAIRKPKISVAGQSDAGKSTLINALLGAEKLPAKWTPTTSIIVYIKHIQDRPAFMNEDVWIFGKRNGLLWDDNRLSNKHYCQKYVIAKGGYSLLETYGIHQCETSRKKEAFSAVAFIDSPLLLDCDLMDLPGFAATKEDDVLHKFNTQENVTDILIYLSRSNGFLQDRDLDYLSLCLKSLRPVENKKNNDLEKLENLFIVASQANTVNKGNMKELREILDRRCHALCQILTTGTSRSLLASRSEQTGYGYNEQDIRKRFYTYEKDSTRLSDTFINAFRTLAEKLPKAFYRDFCKALDVIANDSKCVIKQRIKEYEAMMEAKEDYRNLARDIQEKEPARQMEQKKKEDKLLKFIDELQNESRMDIQSFYTDQMNDQHLIQLIEEREYCNKKGDREEFFTLVNNILTDNIQKILKSASDKYSTQLKQYLDEYNKDVLSEYKSQADISIEFDSNKSFALGLAGLGALGASTTWLATSATAWWVAIAGPMAGLGPILAVGGVIGIAIGGLVAGFLAIKNMFTWKQALAKAIIDSYRSKDYLTNIYSEVDSYWSDTRTAFSTASTRIETDWQNKIKEYEALGDEQKLLLLKQKIITAQRGLDFFIKMPLSRIG